MKAAKRLQDVLGEHQDAVVAEERLRELAAAVPASRRARRRVGWSSGSGNAAGRRGGTGARRGRSSRAGQKA